VHVYRGINIRISVGLPTAVGRGRAARFAARPFAPRSQARPLADWTARASRQALRWHWDEGRTQTRSSRGRSACGVRFMSMARCLARARNPEFGLSAITGSSGVAEIHALRDGHSVVAAKRRLSGCVAAVGTHWFGKARRAMQGGPRASGPTDSSISFLCDRLHFEKCRSPAQSAPISPEWSAVFQLKGFGCSTWFKRNTRGNQSVGCNGFGQGEEAEEQRHSRPTLGGDSELLHATRA
jgi:hypothetical protein